MNDITAQLITRITALVAGLEFDHKPTGATRAVQVVDSFLERPTSGWTEGDDFPWVRVAHYKGAFFPRGAESGVVVVGGIWTSGNIAAGTADIKRLAEALGKLPQVRLLGDHQMSTPVRYYYGETEAGREGLQPHPYHFVTIYLDFVST